MYAFRVYHLYERLLLRGHENVKSGWYAPYFVENLKEHKNANTYYLRFINQVREAKFPCFLVCVMGLKYIFMLGLQKKIHALVFSAILLFSLVGCDGTRLIEHTITGQGFGTFWSVKIIVPPSVGYEAKTIKQRIINIIARLDVLMSTYRDDSEIASFNRSSSLIWYPVASDTAFLVKEALAISDATRGYFDITVAPLVSFWGFGREYRQPLDYESPEILGTFPQRASYLDIEVRETPPSIRKKFPFIRIDLSAIAKGYAIDKIAEMLIQYGYENFLIEFGGELRGSGGNIKKRPWRIGIERPQLDEANRIEEVILLDDMVIATSGDYRNIVVTNKGAMTHIMDPHTQSPLPYSGRSVSVIADTAFEADAWATGLFAMGKERAIEWFGQSEIPFLYMQTSGGKVVVYSNKMDGFLFQEG